MLSKRSDSIARPLGIVIVLMGLIGRYLVVMHATLHGLDPFTTLMACVSVVLCLLELAVVRVDEDEA